MCQRDIAIRACSHRLRECLCVASVLADVPLPNHVPRKPSTRITTVVLIIAHRNGLCLRKRGLSPAERLSFTASAVPNTQLLRLLSLVHPCTAGADELSSHAEEKEKQSNDCNIIGQVNLSVHRGRRRTNHGGAASTQRTTLPRRPEETTRWLKTEIIPKGLLARRTRENTVHLHPRHRWQRWQRWQRQ